MLGWNWKPIWRSDYAMWEETGQGAKTKKLCSFWMAGNYFVHGGAVALLGQTNQKEKDIELEPCIKHSTFVGEFLHGMAGK